MKEERNQERLSIIGLVLSIIAWIVDVWLAAAYGIIETASRKEKIEFLFSETGTKYSIFIMLAALTVVVWSAFFYKKFKDLTSKVIFWITVILIFFYLLAIIGFIS